MNYNFFWDGQPWDRDDIVIGMIFREPWQRPTLGAELKIKGVLVRVTRIVPRDNPDNAAVTYFVEPLNGNWPYKMVKQPA